MTRVVSLLPSTTELVGALGCTEMLVGRSHECDHPPGVEELPALTEPKIQLSGDSAAIDREVRTLLERALSVYRVHTDVLRAVAPDVVLTQTQCEACAVAVNDVLVAVDAHLGAGVEVVATEPNRLADVLDDARRVATALGVEDRGEELADEIAGRVEAVRARAGELPRRRVVTLEWIDPLMAAGNWMPELLEAAGGRELFGAAGAHSPWLDWESVREADPDAIVVLPCGFDLERTREEAEALLRLPGFADLRAGRDGRVVLADGHRYFNRPGPRLADSTEILAEVLHPDEFGAPHEGIAWERMTVA